MTGSFVVAPGHPALPGHFPGRPIVPGVVLLDEVIALITETGLRLAGFPGVKFLRPVQPGERVEVAWQNGRFSASVAGITVLQGQFVLEPPG